MLLCDRRIFCLGLTSLAACGFRPAYGPGGATADLRIQIMVQVPVTRPEYEFVKAVETELGPSPSNATYSLKYSLKLTEESTVVSAAQELNRFNIQGRLQFTLQSTNGDTVSDGEISAFTGYSATGSTLATDRSQRDAEDRLMRILAQKLISRFMADIPR